MKTTIYSLLTLVCLGLISCDEDKLTYKEILEENTYNENDLIQKYYKENFLDPFGSYVVYDYLDKYVDITKTGVPPRKDVLKPIGELIKTAWIQPYDVAADKGAAFLHKYFPKEIILLGSSLRNSDGTVTLGIAESGVRMTFADVNSYNPKATPAQNQRWVARAFRTLHHEFTHIIDQNFRFDPQQFLELSGSGYTSPTSWTTLTNDQAVARGMVTPYATSAPAEDFAELLAYIITTPPEEFKKNYITQYPCANFINPNHADYNSVRAESNYQTCRNVNAGRTILSKKYTIVQDYFKNTVGVDLLKVRDKFLEVTRITK